MPRGKGSKVSVRLSRVCSAGACVLKQGLCGMLGVSLVLCDVRGRLYWLSPKGTTEAASLKKAFTIHG
jgi:hypothetical protein